MENALVLQPDEHMLSYEDFRATVLKDFKVAIESREVSLMGRREVLTGKAKFGIFGDGKEVAQVAMAKFFKPGDFRAGYYRDQTFMFATGLATLQQFFAQLYANPNIEQEPFSAGRQMVGHFSTPNTDDNGDWLPLAEMMNVSADIAPTAGQMPRAVGLAFTSKIFRSNEQLQEALPHLSNKGNEICFCTIGDASTSEGHFWEAINAAGVLQIPLAVFVWDDGYGISVPTLYQTTKGSISAALRGMQKKPNTNGLDIYTIKGWDYAGMCELFETALQKVRDTHIPAVFHVEEITQPQGHSTSGSHERYKTAYRLEWERQRDCIKKMREWIIENEIANEEELDAISVEAKKQVKESRNDAWREYLQPIKQAADKTIELVRNIVVNDIDKIRSLQKIATELQKNKEPLRKDILIALSMAAEVAGNSPNDEVKNFYRQYFEENKKLYNAHLYNEGAKSAVNIAEVKPVIADNTAFINGYEVLNKYFDALFASDIRVVAFGEDVGYIGDVNQGFAGLQNKYGNNRIFDTGIREQTIVGQGIGLALRGLRPFAEIQYIDYLLYGLQTLSDDLATLHYRTGGKQSCPVIIRTRGHRLEGIWHSGSPMGMVINSLRGMHVCVPRNMVQAVGMYNTLLQGNDPAIVIECLNGYRLKEKLPENLLEYRVPLGIPEIVQEGNDVTIVSYGSILRIIAEAAHRLQHTQNISCEIIDVRTLLPFDINHIILNSLKKTNRIVFIDEDVPGGAAAYMFNKVMEEQGGYRWLDVAPKTITGKAHRPAYGTDGDYFSKPNTEDIVQEIIAMMKE